MPPLRMTQLGATKPKSRASTVRMTQPRGCDYYFVYKNVYIYSLLVNNYGMKRFYFPNNSGASCYSEDGVVTAIVGNNGVKRVGCERSKNKIIPWNIFLLRGIEFFIFGLYAQFSTFSRAERLQVKMAQDEGLIGKISEKLNIATRYVQFFTAVVVALILGFFLFDLAPSRLALLIVDRSHNIHLQGLVVGLIRIVLLYLCFVLLRFMPFMQGLYQFNGACNQIVNSNEKITEISKNSPHYALNYLNFVIFASMLATFVVSLIALHIGVWTILANLAIVLLVIMFSYELLWAVSVVKTRWLRDFVYLTSWLVCIKPSVTQEETVRITLNENANFDKEDNLDNENLIPMSAVMSEMQTKLLNADRYDKSDAEWIVATVLNKNRAEAKLVRYLSYKQHRDIMRATERRAKGEPLSSIFGFVDFYGLRFDINKKVLSPRPETEILVETTLKLASNIKEPVICDLCTGSGAIAITIKKNLDAKVYAIDISKPALLIAEANAKKHEVKIDFICSNLFEGLKKHKKFDIIVSNPPYIKSGDFEKLPIEVKKFDPRLALDGGEDGYDFYHQIIEAAPDRLNKNGLLLFELGKGQAGQVRKLLKANGFVDTHTVKDYNGIERVIYARLG